MRKFISTVFVIFLSLSAIAQDAKLFDTLAQSFRNNNSESISSHFSESLDMAIESTDGTFGQKQARVILKDFFSKNQIKSFKINHRGSSNEKTQYCIAEMKSEKKKWSIYILINSQNKITQLQIEEE